MEREPKQITLKLDLTSCRSVKDKAKLKWQRDDVQATEGSFVGGSITTRGDKTSQKTPY